MKHEVSYIFTKDYTTVRSVIVRMRDAGYGYSYKELKTADGLVHKFLIKDLETWIEFPDMETLLEWICTDLYRLKDAYEYGIVCEEDQEVSNAR